MKRAIVTLSLLLALVGFIGLTDSLAATETTKLPICCHPDYQAWIGQPRSCPTPAAHGVLKAPGIMGS